MRVFRAPAALRQMTEMGIQMNEASGKTSKVSEHDDAAAIRKKLGLGKSRVWRRLTSLLILVAVGVGGWFLYQSLNKPVPPPIFLKASLDRGDISTIVSATGTIESVRIAEVGPEISGRITEVMVSENDRVVKGQVLARFDPEPIEARLEQAKAQLEVAAARLVELRATVREASANDKRAKALRKSGVNAERDAEVATASLSRARAALVGAQAQERSTAAQVAQVEADLARAVLYSPIDGVVLTRAVEPGKAVAASLQTPVLFTIAEDLTRMELRLAIDEADVAQIRAGMNGEFTVDAYQDKTFPASVSKVHLAPTVVQNLVTYRAILEVDNKDLLLFPGMTATANITASTVTNVLRVPNAALRFSPPRPPSAVSMSGGIMPEIGRPRGGGRPSGGEEQAGAARGGVQGRLYVIEDGQPTRKRVTIGATDGRFTEILSGELKEGDEVLVGIDTTPPGTSKPAVSKTGEPGNGSGDAPKRDRTKRTGRRPDGKAPDSPSGAPRVDATEVPSAEPKAPSRASAPVAPVEGAP